MPRQVRLDDDVVTALSKLVDAQGEGSISSHANRRLRQALGLPAPGGPAPATGTGARVSTGSGSRMRRIGQRPAADDAHLRARLGAS